MRALLSLTFLLGGCATDTLPPVPLGHNRELPAERNVPRETVVRPGVEVIVYPSTPAEIDALGCGVEHAAGCTMKIDTLCMVWVLDSKLVPQKVTARIDRHERLGHCNGHTHGVHATETGIVIDWN